MKKFKIKYITGRRKEAGSILLVIIISMIVFAVLAVAMYTLTSTATLNQVIAQRAAKSFYVSESGVRIAAGEYKAAASTAKNSTLVNLQGSTKDGRSFTMPDNSTVQLKVYPYWLYANLAIASGTSTITLYLPGVLPRKDDTDTAISFPTTGLLKVRDVRLTTITTWSGATNVSYTVGTPPPTNDSTYDATYGTPVTFSLGTAFTDAIVAGDEFYIGYLTTQDSSQTGNNVSLYVTDIDMAYFFPPQSGTIFVVKSSISYYKYDLRIIDSTVTPIKVTLNNIQHLDGTLATPNVLSGDQVYIGKSVGFRSTSTYSQ